ncbi:MAG TPA: carboxymuconolactone decarboxylase family protein [Acetobacteraceae bacterium]|nr:carboxymuconolactone decarboxylase family protein [Acetobacteraceae bacterium]
MPELDTRRQELKEAFVAARGYWSELWDGVLELSPEFFEAYSALSSVPWKYGTLPPKLKELIYVAVDASTTHLYNPGTRIHIANALKHGATRDEVMEVLEIVSVLGIHTMSTGLPILIDELRNAGRGEEVREGALSPEQQKLKQDFVTNRGYWNPVWEQLLQHSPAFFDAYTRLSSVPWKHGTLEPKFRELIYIAIDAATTHLYLPGLRTHVRNALGHGATVAEIMEVLQLTSTIGIHTVTEGVPILLEEARHAGKR